mgnify:CR=1 FL=1
MSSLAVFFSPSSLPHVAGVTDEQRQALREGVLGATNRDFREFADRLDAVRDGGRVAVVGSAAALSALPDLRVSRVL